MATSLTRRRPFITLPLLKKYAGVAKLDKASDYESEDSRFESWHLQFFMN